MRDFGLFRHSRLMFWSQSQTDRDARDDQLIREQLRHDRRWLEDQKVSWIETTPPGQPIPKHSMAQYREDQQAKMDRAILDVMGTDEDNIPDL